MSKEEKIQRGGLAGKMAGYTPEPPGSVWEGVAAAIRGGGSRRRLFIFLAAAAGLALAITVGVLFTDTDFQEEIALQAPEVIKDKSSDEPSVEQSGRLQQPSAEIPVPQKMDVAGSAGETTGKKQSSRLEEKVRIAVQEVFDDVQGTGQVVLSETVIDVAPVDTVEVSEDEESNNASPTVLPVQKDSFLVVPSTEIAIESDPARKEQSGKWQLGASLTPLYNYRDVTSQDDYSRTLANSSESARLTFAGGVQVSYRPSERVSVESGLYYTRMGVNIGDYSSFKNGWFNERLDASPGAVENVVSISNSMGKIVSANNDLFVSNYSSSEAVADYHMLYPEQMMVDNSVVESFSQSLEYVEIPVNIKYKIIDRSVQVQLIGGVSTNMMINNSVSAHTGEGTTEIGEMQDLRSMNYSGNAGIGFVYDIFESFSLSVEPKFRYYLHSVNTDMLPSTRPYTFGLYTGVNYTF